MARRGRAVAEPIAYMALVAVVLSIAIATSALFLSRSAQVPEAPPTLGYGKLTLLSESNNIGGTLHATFRVEAQILSTGYSGQAFLCLLLPNTTATPPQTWVGEPGSLSCLEVALEKGSQVRSGLVSVPVSTLWSLGCTFYPASCVETQRWAVALRLPPVGSIVSVVPAAYVPP